MTDPVAAEGKWTPKSSWIVAPALLLIAIVSQGVHDLAIEHLGVPYPKLVLPPAWLPTVGDVVRALALILFCLAARARLDRLPLLTAAALVGLLEVALSETVRIAVITLFLANDWRAANWLFVAVDLLVRAAPGFTLGVLALVASRRLRGWRSLLAAVVAAGLLTRLVVLPLVRRLADATTATLGLVHPDEAFRPPYALDMLSVIYVTFLEPTIAAFVMARLCGRGLRGLGRPRVLAFTILVLGAAGRLTLLLVNSFWVRQPPVLAILSTGQFFAETAVMALLTAALVLRRDARGGGAAAPATTP